MFKYNQLIYGALLYTIACTISLTSAQLLPPDMGDNVPKLSMDCYVEFAKYGKPLIDMLMKPNGKTTTQQKLMGLLASPMGTSMCFFYKTCNFIFLLFNCGSRGVAHVPLYHCNRV